MITEDYVSFETAKLLKEKGFDTETEHKMWYVVKQFSTGCHWNSCTYKVGDITREYNNDCCIPMPTLQMAMKWLRKEYGLYIIPRISRNTFLYGFKVVDNKGNIPYVNNLVFDSYEQACEVGIKYCLENLI